jgi:hypothetical protein
MRLPPHVEERDLADRRRDAAVGRRGGQCVAATRRGPERRQPIAVDARQGAGGRDRRAPVLELAARLEQVRLAAAVAEAAVVEDEGGDAGGGESLRERAQPVASRSDSPCAMTTTGAFWESPAAG